MFRIFRYLPGRIRFDSQYKYVNNRRKCLSVICVQNASYKTTTPFRSVENRHVTVEIMPDVKTDGIVESDEKSDTKDRDKRTYENETKNKILEASLPFVSTHGWTKAAITAGAESIGYPGVVRDLFPHGGSSLILYHYEICNMRLKEHLKLESQGKSEDKEKSIQFLREAIEYRLRMNIPYIEKWHQALAALTLPNVVPRALSNILNLVDDMCYYAGDRSTGFDWYIRRVAVAGIYKVTELYMLQDKSPDYKDTWEFLKKQLEEAVALYSYIKESEQAQQLTKEFSEVTLKTVKILSTGV